MRKLLSFLLIFNLAHATAPTGYKNETASSKTYAQDLVFPNNQLTKQAGLDSRIETGNSNLLTNPSFEHSIATTGWTITNATPTADTTNQVEGKKALSLALTGALSVVQDSTINAANLVGLQGVARIKIKTSDVDGLQVCARNAGVTSTSLCINIPKDGVWKEINIPYILTATSNGIAITSTGTTGTVKIDDAFVGTSAPFQNVSRETIVSAKLTTAGTVSDETEDFINGNCAVTGTSTYTCTFNASFFKSTPTCVATPNAGAGTARFLRAVVNTTTNMIFETLNSSAVAATADIMVFCQRTGSDNYGNFKLYSQASQDYDWTSYTPTFTGFGTVTNATFWHKREGSDLLIRGNFQAGTVTATTPSLTLPNSLSIDTTKIPSVVSLCSISQRGISATSGSQYINFTAINPSTPTVLKFATGNNGLTGTNEITNATISFGNGEWESISTCRIPIQGWQDYGVIVGSFADTITTPSSLKRVIHGVDFYTTSPGTACSGTCSLSNYYGASGWITSIVRTGLGDYTLTLNSSYWLDVTKVRCQIKHSDLMFQPKFTIPNSSGVVTINARTNTGSYGGTDIYGTLECTGSIP